MSSVDQNYDVIIVGAGSSGCTLANRLSQDPNCKVLLIEAGPPNRHLYINMPAAVAKAIESRKFNWHYWTSPQQHLNGRQLTTPRGKVLGGSSSINALVYMRGQAEDYQRWAKEADPIWAYDRVLPYFRQTETHCRGGDDFRGDKGELFVADPESQSPMFKGFIEAGQQLGEPFCADFNGANQRGFGYFQLNIKNGKRCSAANAFLEPALTRKNLSVVTDLQVLKLLKDKDGGAKIKGLQCYSRGRHFVLQGEKIILASGAIGSPHILLNSGIGPADELKKLGIDPLIDLKGVGKNLQDHMEVKVKCRINQPLSLYKYTTFPRKYWEASKYLLSGQGVCRQQGLEAGAFISLDEASTSPDTQLHFINALAFDGAKPEDRGHGFAIDITHLRPESRGELSLASADPLQPPLINPNYLATEYDRKMLRKGLRYLRELCAQPALAQYIKSELFPSSQIQSDEQLDEVIRNNAESIYHPVGTAKMGRDELSVVDPTSLKVRGLDNLYIADASIMPSLVSGNTSAVCVMIGAKAADIIAGQ